MNQLTESQMEQMIREQIVDRGVTNTRVIEAIRSVDRERFFPKQYKQEAFADRAAPIGHGQTISQPYIVALMTDKVDVHPEHRVLEIGTGSGYQTAVLCKLAREVYSIERVKPLLDQAFETLMEMNIRNVHFRHGDGTLGWKEQAPFDRILVAAGAPQLPKSLLLNQLADGGLAIMPVGPHEQQMLVSVRRKGSELVRNDIIPCRFVKLIGEEGWPNDLQS
jgi:protein-L-isoaspartate(D-aspartate) O-methyltransferase